MVRAEHTALIEFTITAALSGPVNMVKNLAMS